MYLYYRNVVISISFKIPPASLDFCGLLRGIDTFGIVFLSFLQG